jgi:glycosyltransferase involved in cell wall biosynthesis
VPEPRVIMVTCSYAPARDGLSRQTHRLAKALAAQGVPVTTLTQRLPGTEAREELDGVQVVRLPVPPFGGYRTKAFPFIAAFVPYMLRHRDDFDVVHVHQMLVHAGAAVAVAHRLGKPSIVKVAGGGDSGNVAYLKRWRYSGGLTLRTLRKATRFVSLSEQVTAELAGVGFAVDKIVEIADGIEVERFAMPRTSEGQHVVTAARLSHEKGVDILVVAWPAVARVCPAARLTILGGGDDETALKAQARTLGVADSIDFAGEIEDVRPYLARSIFALPSRNEGMSNALLEAMAAACPIVASDISPNRRLIRDAANGRLFATQNPADLARVITELLGAPDVAARLGAQAAVDVAAFDIGGIARQHRELYSQVLET